MSNVSKRYKQFFIISCATDSPAFRLSDGQYGYDGRVEINLAGVWGTVCGMGLHSDGTARDLLCKEAGPYVYVLFIAMFMPPTVCYKCMFSLSRVSSPFRPGLIKS